MVVSLWWNAANRFKVTYYEFEDYRRLSQHCFRSISTMIWMGSILNIFNVNTKCWWQEASITRHHYQHRPDCSPEPWTRKQNSKVNIQTWFSSVTAIRWSKHLRVLTVPFRCGLVISSPRGLRSRWQPQEESKHRWWSERQKRKTRSAPWKAA